MRRLQSLRKIEEAKEARARKRVTRSQTKHTVSKSVKGTSSKRGFDSTSSPEIDEHRITIAGQTVIDHHEEETPMLKRRKRKPVSPPASPTGSAHSLHADSLQEEQLHAQTLQQAVENEPILDQEEAIQDQGTQLHDPMEDTVQTESNDQGQPMDTDAYTGIDEPTDVYPAIDVPKDVYQQTDDHSADAHSSSSVSWSTEERNAAAHQKSVAHVGTKSYPDVGTSTQHHSSSNSSQPHLSTDSAHSHSHSSHSLDILPEEVKEFNPNLFENRACFNKYRKQLSRSLLTGARVDLNSLGDWNFLPLFEFQNWSRFLSADNPSYALPIRCFYANLKQQSNGSFTTFFKGQKFSFDEKDLAIITSAPLSGLDIFKYNLTTFPYPEGHSFDIAIHTLYITPPANPDHPSGSGMRPVAKFMANLLGRSIMHKGGSRNAYTGCHKLLTYCVLARIPISLPSLILHLMWAVLFKKSVLGFGKLITKLYEFHDIHISSFSTLRPDTVFSATNAVRMHLHPPVALIDSPVHTPPHQPIHSPSPPHSPLIHSPPPPASPQHNLHIAHSPPHVDAPIDCFDGFLPCAEYVPPTRDLLLPDNDFRPSYPPRSSPPPSSHSQPSSSHSPNSRLTREMLHTIIDKVTTKVFNHISVQLETRLFPMLVTNLFRHYSPRPDPPSTSPPARPFSSDTRSPGPRPPSPSVRPLSSDSRPTGSWQSSHSVPSSSWHYSQFAPSTSARPSVPRPSRSPSPSRRQ